MNEKEKRQGTLIFFIVESLLTAFAFKIFKRQARQGMGEIPYFSAKFVHTAEFAFNQQKKNPSSAFIIIKISFSCSRINPAVYKATAAVGK